MSPLHKNGMDNGAVSGTGGGAAVPLMRSRWLAMLRRMVMAGSIRHQGHPGLSSHPSGLWNLHPCAVTCISVFVWYPLNLAYAGISSWHSVVQPVRA